MASKNPPIISPNWANWAKRMTRLNTPKVPMRPDMNDPTQAATEMFSQGMQAGADGTLRPTQDYGGLMVKASQGINSMSRGATGGQFSSLGKPPNSMHEQNPGFFNRGGSAGGVEGFGQMLAQRGQQGSPEESRAQRIATAQQNGTFGSIRDQFNSASGGRQVMNEMGTISAGSIQGRVPMRGGLTPQAAPDPRLSNRQALEQGAAGLKLQREASGEIPTVRATSALGSNVNTSNAPATGETRGIEGKYGRGSATFSAPGVPRKEGLIDKRPFSEVMQGLANKPGVASPGDKFQPQTDNWARASSAPVKSARDLMKGAPTKKPFTTIPANAGKQMLAAAKRKPLSRA